MTNLRLYGGQTQTIVWPNNKYGLPPLNFILDMPLVRSMTFHLFVRKTMKVTMSTWKHLQGCEWTGA